MNQKLASFASIAEILSGLAVVVTLIVLILGIRENTGVVRASMYSDLAEQLIEANRMVVENDQLLPLWLATLSGTIDELDLEEKEKLDLMLGQVLQIVDTAYTTFSYGILSENEWSKFESTACRFYSLRLRLVGDRWRGGYTDGFNAFLESSC